MLSDIIIHYLLPIVDLSALKSFACSNKSFLQVINTEKFWQQRCDRDFWQDESYSCFAQVRDMEGVPTWKKFYSRFFLMRKYQINDQASNSFSWKGIYSFGYAWIRGTRIALTNEGATLCNRVGLNYIPGNLEQYFLYDNNPNFWLESPDELISRLNKQSQCSNFKICTDGNEYDEERTYDEECTYDENDVYLIHDKGKIVSELNNIKKVAKFLYYDFEFL